jgi:hypothetical protein
MSLDINRRRQASALALAEVATSAAHREGFFADAEVHSEAILHLMLAICAINNRTANPRSLGALLGDLLTMLIDILAPKADAT